MPKIAIVVNWEGDGAGPGVTDPDVTEVLESAEAIRCGLTEGGMDARVVRVASIRDVERAIAADRPDLVFHMVESLHGNAAYEPAVAWRLERLGVPFAGSGARTLRLCLDKDAAVRSLASLQVPVPRAVLWSERCEHPGFPLPAFVKPRRTDASIGISCDSVVRTPDELTARARHVARTYGGWAVVQEYLPGREINVAFLGDEPLPPSEIDFSGFPEDRPRIVTYDAKWIEDSPEYKGTRSVRADLDAASLAEVLRVARRAYAALGVRDFGRVDLRMDARGHPRVIEVNPNCDLAADAGFIRTCEREGLTHGEVIRKIAHLALSRVGIPVEQELASRKDAKTQRSSGKVE